MIRILRAAGLGIILLAILLTLFPISASAFEIKLGNVREQTINWLVDQHKLSRDSAEQMMRRYARRNRADIIDSVEFPDGAIADFVSIDPTKPGTDQVEYEGCAMLFSPGSEFGRRFLAEVEKTRGTPAYDYFRARFADAVRRGVFAHELTAEQKDRLLNAGQLPSERRRPVTATPIRILVVSFRTPPWSDRASSPSYLPHGHPMLGTPGLNEAERGETAGGGWSNGARVGLNSPAWNESHRGHDDPTNGPDSFVYLLRTDFVERWFTFMFDYGNPNSLANFYRSESHGNIAITGDRSDIAAWLDSHHVLDVNPFGSARDWTPMPGTPIVRPIDPGEDFIYRASVETGQFSVLFRDHNVPGRSTISNYRFNLPGGTAPDSPPYRPFGTARTDPNDDRHVTFTGVNYRYWNTSATPNAWANTTVANGEGYTLRFCSAGWTGNTSPTPNGTEYTADGDVGGGCAPLPNTTIDQTEANSTYGFLQSRPYNRFKSICYYTHDHDFSSKSNRPHQLAHIRNSGGDYDDIMGTVQTNLNDHVDRPRPYDHDLDDDDARPTGGYFGTTPGHTTGAWISDCNAVMADWGITSPATTYQKIAYVYPYGSAVVKGAHIFIPMGGGSLVTLPENAGLALAGHEFGHTFGAVDLYDVDFYANNASPPPSPPYFESDAAGPYSIMANGGVRFDPWHKIALGWVTPTLLATGSPLVPQDRVNAPLPEMEGTLQNPVVYKARPDLATGISTSGQEYFLIENRNRNGSAWYGDPSPRGMYIWHIDNRFSQTDEVYFRVICEQADAQYQLERQPRSWNVGQPDAMAGDPFPGSFNVRQFTQWTDPNSRTHGVPAGRGQVVPGSAHDSFFRVDAISDPGPTMRANLWVQPRELIVTDTSYAPPTALQGDKDVEILGLHLDNNTTSPNISQGDVVIREIRIDESGNSNNDTDVARALVYEDVGTIGTVEPGTDVLLQTAPVVGQQATFTGLSFRVVLGTTRDLLIAYDIADTAQTEPAVTVGAGIDHPFPNSDPASPWSAITPQIPGTIQERVRTGVGTFGAAWFPERSDSDKVVILEAPDTLTITPTDVAPATAIQGTPDVPMLGLRLHVDRDTVELQSLRVDTTGTSTRVGDVSGKLYDDANINGVLDPGEALIDTATFAQPGGSGTPILAMFDDLHSYQITETADRGLLVVYDFASDATVGATVNATLQDASYVVLIEPDDVVSTANFPMASSDTTIVINNPPTLTDTASPPGTTDWLTPTTGTPTTVFTWNAVYTDAENDPPAPIQVFIDGAPNAMFAVNPVDTNYTDGALFRYQTTLPVGNHTYYMFASDGTSNVRYPPTPPATYPFPVVNNTPPVLSNGSVTPMRGDDTTTFTYRITFTDADAHMASFVRVLIDGGGGLAMTEDDPTDLDTTDGKLYELALAPGTLTPGAHKAVFRANDGYDTVTWPPIGAMSGPIVSSDSSGFFADDAYSVKSGPYEEGDPIYAQITDIDQNLNVGALDTLQARVRVITGGDFETITLIETAVDSGIFRTLPSGVPTLGRSGAPQDGVINVVAGPTGNTLLLTYADPLDPTDTQSLVATVVDTVAPTAIAPTELNVSCDGDGSRVTVNFTAYDEAAQVDVNRYRVFYELSPAPIGTLTPRATLAAGTQTVQIPTGGPGPDIYVAVAVYDEVPNVDTAVNWEMVSTADTDPPDLVAPNPPDGATEVALDTNISFHVDDAGSGVAESDISVRIRQDPADPVWRNVTADLNIQGTAKSREVSYDPPVDFLYNQTIRVRVIAQDLATNGMVETFRFSTVTDVDPPQITNISPPDGDSNVPVDTSISFDLLDTPSGVDDASIHVVVEGTNVSSVLQLSGTPDARSVLYEPPGDFPYGETIDVTVDASDVAGNAMPTATFSFDTIPDNVGVVIDRLTPADGATGVPIDTNISFRVQDATSGVNLSSIQLTVDGSPIALKPIRHFTQLSPSSYLVTYNPPSDFDYSQLVAVEASAQDNAGNPRTTASWSFETEPPPTYSITGTIAETLPDDGSAQAGQSVPVAGVKVEIKKPKTGDVVLTVYTAGTGVYQARGLLAGSYIVEPQLTDYTFASKTTGKPFQRVYVGEEDMDEDGNPDLDASGIDFNAVRQLYSITGHVLEGGAGLEGVQVTDGTRTAITDPNGQYRLEDVPSGTYTVTPSLTNYTFSPASRAAVVASANATGIDFTATARTYTVSGTVSDPTGARLSGVEIRVQGGRGVAVTSRAGQYTLTGVKAGVQTIVASRDGYVFDPAPGVVVENVMVDHDLTGVDFVGYPVVERAFGAGVHFIGVPIRPRSQDAETVFGTRDVVRWSPTSVPPRYYSAEFEPNAAILRVEPAAGFFVRFTQPTDLSVAGTPVPLTTPFSFVINEGWNMQAIPFPTPLSFANLVPNVAGNMAPYGFVLEGGSYELVSDDPDLQCRRWVDGWEGVWLYGNAAGTTITALPPGSSPAAAADEPAKRVVDRDNWQIPIVATAAGSVDACSVVGVSARAGNRSVPNPPPLPGAVDVVLRGGSGEALAYDLRATLGAAATWRFSVHTDASNVDVQIALPDLSEVPADLSVTLVDVAASEVRYARTMPSYVYNSGQGGAREFVLKVEPRKTTGLTIRTAGARVGPRGAAVTYILSADADVRARVLNIAGRVIRTLSRSKTVAAGTNTLVWDLSSDLKTRVPSGRYLVEIEASTQDGQRVRVLEDVAISR